MSAEEPANPGHELPLDAKIVGAVVGAAFGCVFGALVYGAVKWLGIESGTVRLLAFLAGPVVVGALGFRLGPGRIGNEALSWLEHVMLLLRG